MARLVVLFAYLIFTLAVIWVLTMVVDMAHSIFPSELPERPRKLSLKKRLSQKLASSKTKRSQSVDISPPFPPDGFTPVAYAPIAPVANVTSRHVLTRDTQPISSPTLDPDDQASSRRSESAHRSIRSLFSPKRTDSGNTESDSLALAINHQATSPPHPTIYRKPVPLTVGDVIRDPLIERYERLRRPQNGKPQPRSFEPAVSPPLSQTTSTSPSLQPTKDFFQTAKLAWDKMAVSSPSLPTLREETSMHRRRSDLGFKPRATLRTRSDGPHPIDEGSDEEPNEVAPKRSNNPFQRHMNLRKRELSSSRNQTTSLPRSSKRRNRSPSASSDGSEGGLTPRNSEDVSYPDLFLRAVKPKELHQPPTSEGSDARFLDSEDASRLQERLDRRLALQMQQEEETQYQKSFYAQLRDAHQLSSARERCDIGESQSRAGTQDNPIDLDSDDSSEVIFTGRNRRVERAASHAEPMDLDQDNWNCRLDNELDTLQTTLDAELAYFLHEEEEQARQTAISTRECAVCGDRHPISELPSLAECKHPPQTCAECYAGWVASQLEGSGWKEAKCPEGDCKIQLTYHEVQQIATPDIFEKYDTFIARAAISEDRKFQMPRISSDLANTA